MQEMQSSNCRRYCVAKMWVVSVMLLLSAAVFTANAHRIEPSAAVPAHLAGDALQVNNLNFQTIAEFNWFHLEFLDVHWVAGCDFFTLGFTLSLVSVIATYIEFHDYLLMYIVHFQLWLHRHFPNSIVFVSISVEKFIESTNKTDYYRSTLDTHLSLDHFFFVIWEGNIGAKQPKKYQLDRFTLLCNTSPNLWIFYYKNFV